LLILSDPENTYFCLEIISLTEYEQDWTVLYSMGHDFESSGLLTGRVCSQNIYLNVYKEQLEPAYSGDFISQNKVSISFQVSAVLGSSSLGNWDKSNSSASASINELSGVISAWLDSKSCRP
jgi:hypothetical protein